MKKLLLTIILIIILSLQACTKITLEDLFSINTPTPKPDITPVPVYSSTPEPTPEPTQAAIVGTIKLKYTTSTLNVRSETNSSSEILGELPDGASIEILEEDGNWVKIKYNDIIGYIYSKFVIYQ